MAASQINSVDRDNNPVALQSYLNAGKQAIGHVPLSDTGTPIDFNTYLTAMNNYLAAIDGRVDGLESQLGLTNEAAPASDTATAALNGRLQRISQRLTSLLALQPLAASAPTYMASGTAYGGYAAPTDMLVLKGSASKTVRVLQMLLYIQSTSATLLNASFIRRTAANTGGTVSNPTPFAFDTSDPSATAVVDLYSAAPSALGAGNTLITVPATTTVTTSPAAAFQLTQALTAGTFGTAVSLGEALTLRGVAQSLAFNLGGAGLPAGFTANWNVVWTEV